MNTITKILSGATLLSAALFTSCQRADNSGLVNPLDARDGSFTIVGNLADYSLRAHDAVWEAGDKIGVFAFEKGSTTAFGSFANVEYSAADAAGLFKASNGGITLKGSETADIAAYYPYSSDGISGATLSIGIADQDPLRDIDLLWGKGSVPADVATSAVPVTFTHKLSLVEIKFEAKDGYDLPSEMKAKFAGVTTDASLDIATGALAKGGTKGDLEFTAKSNAIHAILIPGEVLSGIDFTFDGVSKSFDFTAPYTLEAGKKYTFTFRPFVDLEKVEIEVVAGNAGGSITDWSTDATFEGADLEYGDASEDPDPGTGGDPETPEVNLLFTGADFENEADVTAAISARSVTTYTLEAGSGRNGSGAMRVNYTSTKNSNGLTFRLDKNLSAAPSKISFYIKGTSTVKSLSVNVYGEGLSKSSTTSTYEAFNIGSVDNADLEIAKGPQNDYGGSITADDWVKVTLDLSSITEGKVNTAAGSDILMIRFGKDGVFDLYIDDITFE